MSNQDRLTSSGPARVDPELGDTTAYDPPPSAGAPGPGGPGATDRARDVAATGRDQAQQVATTATEQARDVASTARGEAQHVAQTAQGQARRMAYEARDELRTQANAQVSRLADGLGDLSRQLRSMGERGDPGPATDLAGQAATRTQQVADRLRSGGWDDAVGQVRSFGRNRPGLFLLGAFGLGLAAGRVVRNLAEDASGDGSESGRSQGTLSSAGGAYRASDLQSPTPALDGAPYATPAPAVGQTLPPSGGPPPVGAAGVRVPPQRAFADEEGVDASAQRAYGAPDMPIEPPASNTAPVGERRWGT